MSNSQLSVEIGADVTSLRTNLAVAKAELKDTSSEVRNFASQMVEASDAAKAELLPQLEALTAREAELRSEITETNAALKEHTGAAEGTAGAFVRLRETTEGLNLSIAETKGIFTGLSELFLVGLGGEKIYEAVKSSVELGDALQKTSEETGIEVEKLSALKGAADYADVAFDTLQRSLTKFSTNLQSAQIGSGKVAETLHALGISQGEIAAHGNDAAYMLERVSKALDQYGDGANKSAIVSELFGAKMRDMGVILKDVAENGLAGLTDRARDQGILFDGEYSESATKAHGQLVELDHTMEALKADAIVLVPAIEAVAHAIELIAGGDAERAQVHLQAAQRGVSDMSAEIANMQKRMQTDGPILRLLEESDLRIAESRLADFEADVQKYQARIKDDSWAGSAGSLVPPEAKPDAPVPTDLAAQRKAAEEAKRLKQEEYQEIIAVDQAEAANYASTSDERLAILGKELETAKQFWGTGSKQFAEIQKEINSDDRARLAQSQQIMEEGTQAFIQSKNTELQAAIAHYEKLVQQHKISIDDAAALEVNLTNQVYAQELKRLDLEMTMLDEGTSAWQKAYDERAKIAVAQVDQLQKITDKAADEEAKKQEQVYSEIARSGAQNVAQLITGRQTLAQAVENLAEQGLEKVLEYGFKEVLEHGFFETTKVASTVAGEQAQVAAKIAGVTEGKAVEAAAGSVSVMGDAAKAYAGAYSAVVGIPYVGPILAPIAGGVAYAAVAAYDVFSAEGGFDIPAGLSPMVQTHAREMILPAKHADVIRQLADDGGAGGGSFSPTIHITANGKLSASDIQGLGDAVVSHLKHAHRIGAFATSRG